MFDKSLYLPLLALASLPACADILPGEVDRDLHNDPPLARIDDLLHGAPKADEIPRAGYPADEVLPARFDELRSLQSPVKSQGKRGVCSIFSTVGLMEHLYIKEGTIDEPDFSEQFLQWSAKFEVNSFPDSSGSNAFYNLRAIHDYGIVTEDVWPYEPLQWGEAEDPDCDGEDDQPTHCYTNGHPDESVLGAQRWHLPPSKWLHHLDIKQHLLHERTGVIAGMTFFYQAWNHRKSELPTSPESWDQGYVIYPSKEDEEISLEKRAGHSILLYGWDDDILMPVLDSDGSQLLDEDGEPVFEKGCYLFKNSWGTEGFGLESEWGPGYGCISYRYIDEYARLRTTGLPVVQQEICGDDLDNDGNGATDCEDEACSALEACQSDWLSFDGEGGISIPDNDPVGIASEVAVAESGEIAGLRVDVDISHTARGDLRVSLHRGDRAIVLHDRAGGLNDDLVETYEISDFDGEELAGAWRLVVVDTLGADLGTLNSWKLSASLR